VFATGLEMLGDHGSIVCHSLALLRIAYNAGCSVHGWGWAMTIDADEHCPTSWAEFTSLVATQFGGRWHFRGCLDHHKLESSLERAATNWAIPLADLPNVERRLLRDFKRAFPANAVVETPTRDEDLDWLALMQHYGAPTRLLDFTYSPFIAAFFALEMLLRASPSENHAAVIWALAVGPVGNEVIKETIPQGALRSHFVKYSQERNGKSFKAVFLDADPPLRFVTPVNPYRLNERMIAQQGLFLCPGDISQPFETNLEAVPSATDASNLRKVFLSRSLLPEAFRSFRSMNITASSLFPGVDGYARSQYHSMDFIRSVPLFDGTI
jgi:FRG domain-containing protein